MILSGIEWIAVLASCVAASIHCVHVFQMERYQLPVFSQWLTRNREHIFRTNGIAGFALSLLSGYLPILLTLFSSVESTRNAVAGWLTLAIYLGVTTVFTVRELRAPEKKPLVLTMRARRLFAALAAMYAVLISLLKLLSLPPYIVYAAVPFVVRVAGQIMSPIEERINAGFYEQARKKLRARKDLIKIGITGSYGKTLTKFILKELLGAKYEVLATPASFNTAMGISRVVNDQLSDTHQVFIAEMGAQHVGDIKHLVKLVHPKYGMITSIGAQHLDSFGSMANIAETKYELIEGLPEDGAAFFAADNGYTDRLFGMCKKEKYNACVDQPGDCYMRAAELTMGAEGMRFSLECADGGRVWCQTCLLGRYNAQNIALAAAVAHKMGLTMEEIAEGIARLKPFEQKLQLIPGERIVIDDTLNRDALGAAEALNVLSEFPGRRVIVTPGLPGDPARMYDANYAFGTQMQGCVDAVVLVGEKKTVRPIARGILSVGFPKNCVHLVADLNDAEDLLDEILSPGDTVLYECAMEEE